MISLFTSSYLSYHFNESHRCPAHISQTILCVCTLDTFCPLESSPLGLQHLPELWTVTLSCEGGRPEYQEFNIPGVASASYTHLSVPLVVLSLSIPKYMVVCQSLTPGLLLREPTPRHCWSSFFRPAVKKNPQTTKSHLFYTQLRGVRYKYPSSLTLRWDNCETVFCTVA